EAEQRAMWAWIRDFHKEYNDDWFTRNMPRLRDQFRPVFIAELKSMKAKVAGATGEATQQASAGADLLDFAGGQPTPAPPAVPARAQDAGGDLLSLGLDLSPPATSAPSSATGDLFSLALDAPQASDPFATGGPLDAMLGGSAPAPTGSSAAFGLDDVLGGLSSGPPPGGNSSGLFDLDFGAPSSAGPVLAMAAAPTQQIDPLLQFQQSTYASMGQMPTPAAAPKEPNLLDFDLM
ncbi:unnamed protein product, partial [Polarella glacialis]